MKFLYADINKTFTKKSKKWGVVNLKGLVKGPTFCQSGWISVLEVESPQHS